MVIVPCTSALSSSFAAFWFGGPQSFRLWNLLDMHLLVVYRAKALRINLCYHMQKSALKNLSRNFQSAFFDFSKVDFLEVTRNFGIVLRPLGGYLMSVISLLTASKSQADLSFCENKGARLSSANSRGLLLAHPINNLILFLQFRDRMLMDHMSNFQPRPAFPPAIIGFALFDRLPRRRNLISCNSGLYPGLALRLGARMPSPPSGTAKPFSYDTS